MSSQKKSKNKIIIIAVVVVAILIVLHIITGFVLLSPSNLLILAGNMAVPTIIALGFTFIFACNITDLSPGAIVLLTANCAGIIGNACGSPVAAIPAMLVGCIAVGVACGFINFTIYRVSKIPPWIAGLGMTMAYEAIVGIYSQARANKGLQVEFLRDENRILGSQPWIFIVLIICVVISYIIYNHTTIGINIRAAGCNENVGYQCFKDTDHRRHYCRIILRHRWCGKRECFHFYSGTGWSDISFHCVPATCSSTSCKGTFQKYQPYYCGTDQYIYYRCYLQRTDTFGCSFRNIPGIPFRKRSYYLCGIRTAWCKGGS